MKHFDIKINNVYYGIVVFYFVCFILFYYREYIAKKWFGLMRPYEIDASWPLEVTIAIEQHSNTVSGYLSMFYDVFIYLTVAILLFTISMFFASSVNKLFLHIMTIICLLLLLMFSIAAGMSTGIIG